jgi:hypothetical protein
MAQTTFEEAKRCPKCGIPGEDVSQQKVTNRDLKMGTAVAHVIMCRNDACNWYNTSWIVQVNPDQTVPVMDHSRTEKQFPNRSDDEVAQRVIASIERQVAQERKSGGGEISGPRR